MAANEHRIIISVEARDAQRQTNDLSNTIGGLINSVTGASGAFGALKGAVGAYLSLNALKSMVMMADATNLLQARINDATASLNNYAEVWGKLQRISSQTGTSMEASVSLFSAVSRAAGDLGRGTDEVLKMQKELQQLGAISGASAEAMKFGLLQFSQAMAGGIVRAEEFNSIVENLPAVARAIAEGLNKTQGELRLMVVDGKLLANDVFNSLLGQSEKIQERFDALPPSISRSGVALENAFGNALSEADKLLGTTEAIANFITILGRGLDVAAGKMQEFRDPTIEQELDQVLEKTGKKLDMLTRIINRPQFDQEAQNKNVDILNQEIAALIEKADVLRGLMKIEEENSAIMKRSGELSGIATSARKSQTSIDKQIAAENADIENYWVEVVKKRNAESQRGAKLAAKAADDEIKKWQKFQDDADDRRADAIAEEQAALDNRTAYELDFSNRLIELQKEADQESRETMRDMIDEQKKAADELAKKHEEIAKDYARAIGDAVGAAMVSGNWNPVGAEVAGVAGDYAGSAIGTAIGGPAGAAVGGVIGSAVTGMITEAFSGSVADPIVEELKAIRVAVQQNASVLTGEYAQVKQLGEQSWQVIRAFNEQVYAANFANPEITGLGKFGGTLDEQWRNALIAISQATGSTDWAKAALEFNGLVENLPQFTNEVIALSKTVSDFEEWAGVTTAVQRAQKSVDKFNSDFKKYGYSIDGTKASAARLYQQLNLTTKSGIEAYASLSQLTDEIETLEKNSTSTFSALQTSSEYMLDTMLLAFGQRTKEASAAVKSYTGHIVNLKDVVDDILLGQDSTLTPLEKMMEAQDQYNDLLTKTKNGDFEAAGKLGESSKKYLEASRAYYASGQDYTNIFNTVISNLTELGTVSEVAGQSIVDQANAVKNTLGTPIATEDSILGQINKLAASNPEAATGYLVRLISLSESDTPQELAAFIGKIVDNAGALGTASELISFSITELVRTNQITSQEHLASVVGGLLDTNKLAPDNLAATIKQLQLTGTLDSTNAGKLIATLGESKNLTGEQASATIVALAGSKNLSGAEASATIKALGESKTLSGVQASGLITTLAEAKNLSGAEASATIKALGESKTLTGVQAQSLITTLATAGTLTSANARDLISVLAGSGTLQSWQASTLIDTLKRSGTLTSTEASTLISTLSNSKYIVSGQTGEVINNLLNSRYVTAGQVGSVIGSLLLTNQISAGQTPTLVSWLIESGKITAGNVPSVVTYLRAIGQTTAADSLAEIYGAANAISTLDFSSLLSQFTKQANTGSAGGDLAVGTALAVATQQATTKSSLPSAADIALAQQKYTQTGGKGTLPADSYAYWISVAKKSYATGTDYVPSDMLAQIHQGEMVIDRASSDALRNYGINVSADNPATLAVLNEMAAEMRELRRVVNRQAGAIVAGVRA